MTAYEERVKVVNDGAFAVAAVPAETVLAGAASVLGLIGTVPASGVLYVRCPCPSAAPAASKVDWRVVCNKIHAVQLYRARAIVNAVTLTFSSLADGETLIVNGLTYTAKDAGNTVASRYFNTGGADATADAAAFCVVFNDAASGTLGMTATSSLGVVSLVATTATVIQAVTGTAGAHCAVASATLTSLIRHGAPLTGVAADTTDAGYFVEQYAEGWPQLYLGLTNSDATAATVVIGGTVYL